MPEQSEAQAQDRPCVLVVEDSPTTRIVIERHLKQYFDLVTAADGLEAWELLQNDNKIELVITDINMPRMSGIELLQNIRSSGQSRINQLPVFIMTSADDDESDKNQALDLGANDFITKPINPIVLRARVNVHHRLAKATQQIQHSSAANQAAASTGSVRLSSGSKFEEATTHEFETAQNDNVALSLVMFDIDRYSDLLKTYGEAVCEEIVSYVSSEFSRLLRGIDTGAYLDNGRYSALLPGTRRLGAAVVAERIRSAIEKLEIPIDTENSVSVTASVAMATLPVDPASSINDMKAICENRLTIAHNLGNNRICVNDEGHTSFSRS